MAKEREIYIVIGHTGEYSDHRDWLVRAFADEKKAQDFVILATQEAHRIQALPGEWYDKREEPSTVDPNFRLDDTGTHYELAKVMLEGK